ncbi:MAG: Ig-like domain-containing protein [Lentisphaeria bacterium]|nr:Ig-like domain-containing protein [Candidatus Neomarinimicrobiota bacterium]MCF7843258.1 Ig-like domain-containing protein [Lentisphaeria bacterium]
MPSQSYKLKVYKPLVSLLVVFLMLFPISLGAQSLNNYTFCLDPGHGHGNPNTGPTGLHEHIINMRASRALSDLLYSVNADTVILTRDEFTTADPTLSQREQIANSNNVDWFHSVHHNATGWPENPSVRYTLVLYSQNGDETPLNPGSEAMSPLISQRIFQGLRTSEFRVFGDFNFYGSPNYLGVLNDLTMPSELSEATFHDNPGEEAKLYNPDFTRMEGRGIFYGMLDYFTSTNYWNGVISGIITDSDSGEPLDSVRVTLTPGDSVHYTDNYHSGYYAFHNLAPGQYVVSIEKENYVDLFDTVQVHPGIFDFADFATGSTAPPELIGSTPTDSSTGFGIWENLSLTFSRPMNRVSVEEAICLCSVDDTMAVRFSWDATSENVTLNPLGALQPDTWYELSVDTTATDLFGHPLIPDPAGSVHFQTAYTYDQMIPIALSPTEQEHNVSLYNTISITFSRPLADGVNYANSIVILSDNFRRINGRVDVDASNEGIENVLTLIPDTPLQTNRSYTATLMSSIADTGGMTMANHFTWTFHATDRSFQTSRMDSGQSLTNWEVDYLTNATVAPVLATIPAIHDSFAIAVTLNQTEPQNPSTAGLRWTGSPLEVHPNQVFGFYAKGLPPVIFDSNGSILANFEASPGWHFYTWSAEFATTLGGIGFSLPADSSEGTGYLDEVVSLTDITPLANETGTLPTEFKLFAYPNPFNPQVHLVLPDVPGSKKLFLYSLRGELVLETYIPAYQRKIDLNFQQILPNAPSGVYLARIRTNAKEYSTKLLYLK